MDGGKICPLGTKFLFIYLFAKRPGGEGPIFSVRKRQGRLTALVTRVRRVGYFEPAAGGGGGKTPTVVVVDVRIGAG